MEGDTRRKKNWNRHAKERKKWQQQQMSRDSCDDLNKAIIINFNAVQMKNLASANRKMSSLESQNLTL